MIFNKGFVVDMAGGDAATTGFLNFLFGFHTFLVSSTRNTNLKNKKLYYYSDIQGSSRSSRPTPSANNVVGWSGEKMPGLNFSPSPPLAAIQNLTKFKHFSIG